jgi:hypothetical protein
METRSEVKYKHANQKQSEDYFEERRQKKERQTQRPSGSTQSQERIPRTPVYNSQVAAHSGGLDEE